ncbi:hypothetical protein [Streptomyces africanus]|nr:hypothetical protein [Streptomyces africanus]
MAATAGVGSGAGPAPARMGRPQGEEGPKPHPRRAEPVFVERT